ncbi:hypothetical protein SVIO_048240 [Streptomyces violaceusniger]|uniref:Uncharacterized protein n=1 Tax=Streptomyces violaceusniger TaxID=68280 RepID=A0A4D4KXY9_STRVO|nr:hypothetical protein SVIO_048240 [Streptomyces violaceusniger]
MELRGGPVPDDADERERPHARRGDAPLDRGVSAPGGHASVQPATYGRAPRAKRAQWQRLRGADGDGPLGPGVGGSGVQGEGKGEGGGARDADRGCQVCTHDWNRPHKGTNLSIRKSGHVADGPVTRTPPTPSAPQFRRVVLRA